MFDNIALANLKAGEKAEVIRLHGGYGFVRRLQEMGLVPGQIIEVVRNTPVGPVEVSVLGTHLAVGRGIASKIIVRPLHHER
jgi:ferrous iron transport protein A